MRTTFELHGFSSIETRAVEPLEHLLSKVETSKEVYTLNRLQDKDGSRPGLHFDLTVPLSRYVIENAGKLTFPFKRYQIQKVWRGERPQEGRYREFTQADVDVVGDGSLSFSHEVELPLVMVDALSYLPVPSVVVHASNRKLAQGFYESIGIDDIEGTLRAIDKLDKIGEKAVEEILVEKVSLTSEQAKRALQLAQIKGSDASIADRVYNLGARGELLDEGLNELVNLVENAQALIPGSVIADLKIARGLDYYTGSVYESFVGNHEDLGSICSGGRYDALARQGNKTYPGVGLSIGISRLLSRVIGGGHIHASRQTPTCVLIALNNDCDRLNAMKTAMSLRHRGIPTDVSPEPIKFGKQIRYADRRGIPYVLFDTEEGWQIKDIRSGEQISIDILQWMPPAEDIYPQIVEQSE